MFMGKHKKTDSKEVQPKRTDGKEDQPDAATAPYLPLDSYDVSRETARLIPSHIAKKYNIMPIERTGNIISLVMEDPLNEEAVKAVEELTGCVVRRFIGTHAEIANAISFYMPEKGEKTLHPAEPATVSVSHRKEEAPDKKAERRSAFRFKCDLRVYFPDKEAYMKGQVVDVSYAGIAFISKSPIAVGTYLNVKIDFPEKTSLPPVAMLLFVVRSVMLDAEHYCVGGKLIRITIEDIKRLVKHFGSHDSPVKSSYRGIDRRKYVRFKSNMHLFFPVSGSYVKTIVDDISDCGFSFKSRIAIPRGAYLSVEIEPPKNIYTHPLVWLTEVARVTATQENSYTIGVRWVKSQGNYNDIEKIIQYITACQKNKS